MTTPVVTDEQLGAFARRQNDLFRRVREGSVQYDAAFRSLQDVIESNFNAVPVGPRRLVDSDAQPYIPDDCTIVEHRKGGEVDASKIALYLDPRQQSKNLPTGDGLRTTYANKVVYNACVADHLMKNTSLIPESWKGKYVCFWGTVYRNSDGSLFVRYVCWFDGQWQLGYWYLGDEFDAGDPAAVPVE